MLRLQQRPPAGRSRRPRSTLRPNLASSVELAGKNKTIRRVRTPSPTIETQGQSLTLGLVLHEEKSPDGAKNNAQDEKGGPSKCEWVEEPLGQLGEMHSRVADNDRKNNQ